MGFTFARALVVAVSVGAGAFGGMLSANAAIELQNVNGNFGIAADHSTPDQIADDLKAFTEVYRDYAELFSAADFRTPFAKKVIDKIKFDKPETQLKLAVFKKKLDQLQKTMRSYLLLNSVRVSDKQMPRIYKVAKLAAERLELRGNFNVFILNSPTFNAFTYSYNVNDFDVVLHSGAAEKLSDDALLALLGHEMGHVKDQAILMKLVLAADFESRNKNLPAAASATGFYNELFDELPNSLSNFPNMRALMAKAAASISADGGAIAAFTDEAEASEFSRNCELNADRAAVIASQGEGPALKLLAALAHGSKALTSDFDVEELIKQISEVLSSNEEPGDIEALLAEQETHPFPVVRLIHARAYAASKSLKALLATLAQDAFSKEIDLLSRNIIRFVDIQTRFKNYQTESAETDDMLVRLKTEKQYQTQAEKTGTAASTLLSLVVLQLEGSDLTKKDNALFKTFVEKAKMDGTGALRQVAVPQVSALLEKLANQAQKDAKDDAATELRAKLKVLEILKDLG